MVNLLLGQSGVGKTGLLSRIRTYLGDKRNLFFDFNEQTGLDAKAQLQQILQTCANETRDVYIAARAADFNLDELKLDELKNLRILSVKRPDEVNQSETSETLILSEGFEFPNEAEKDFFRNEIKGLEADITLLPQNFLNFGAFVERRLPWGVRRFELRDDLLSEQQIKVALAKLPKGKVLFSFRKIERLIESQKIVQEWGLPFDWPNELPMQSLPEARSIGEPLFFSLHEPQVSRFKENLKYAESFQTRYPGCILKIALPVANFEELQAGHEWLLQDPKRRVFLPMSTDGKWSWYRLWMQPVLQLNFLREGSGSALDQPSLMDWLRRQSFLQTKNFAAILGDPVKHSRTPAEQFDFFKKLKYPVLAIRMSEEDWEPGFVFIKALGLKAAAVTAPLKHKAFLSCDNLTETAAEMRAVNTLWLSRNSVSGDNTDLGGFEFLLGEAKKNCPTVDFKQASVAIWGGGGTLKVLKTIFPSAILFSARTGQPRETLPSNSAEVLIWALGRSRFAGLWPAWHPRLIIDLNYGDDSPGREFAAITGAAYQSGLAMFKGQAQKQREFWKNCQMADQT